MVKSKIAMLKWFSTIIALFSKTLSFVYVKGAVPDQATQYEISQEPPVGITSHYCAANMRVLIVLPVTRSLCEEWDEGTC